MEETAPWSVYDGKDSLTSENIAEMDTDELLNEGLVFKSNFIAEDGPKCSCQYTQLTRFIGYIPNKLCEKRLSEVDPKDISSMDSVVSSICACQQSHFFRITVVDSKVNFEPTTGKIGDTRKLKLPNFY
jgi:hypothetical protein